VSFIGRIRSLAKAAAEAYVASPEVGRRDVPYAGIHAASAASVDAPVTEGGDVR